MKLIYLLNGEVKMVSGVEAAPDHYNSNKPSVLVDSGRKVTFDIVYQGIEGGEDIAIAQQQIHTWLHGSAIQGFLSPADSSALAQAAHEAIQQEKERLEDYINDFAVQQDVYIRLDTLPHGAEVILATSLPHDISEAVEQKLARLLLAYNKPAYYFTWKAGLIGYHQRED